MKGIALKKMGYGSIWIGIILLIGAILVIITQALGLMGSIFGFNIKDVFKEPTPPVIFSEPFDFKLDPEFIVEGQHSDGVLIKITISNLNKNNITFLQLIEENVMIERLNKNEQTKAAKRVNWISRWGTNSYRDNYVIDYPGNTGSYDEVVASLGAQIASWANIPLIN